MTSYLSKKLAQAKREKADDQIKLFGSKKKTRAEEVVDELLDEGVPAKLIEFSNGEQRVVNLVNGETVYTGNIAAEKRDIKSNVAQYEDRMLENMRRSSPMSDPTRYTEPSSDDSGIDDSFVSYDVEKKDPEFEGGIFIPTSEDVVTTSDAFGKNARYIPNTDYPRREINAERSFVQRVGDRFEKVFLGKNMVDTVKSPISGSTEARDVPFLGSMMDLAAFPTPFAGIGGTMGAVADKMFKMQEEDARNAVEGFPGYAAITAIDLGTGQPVDITGRPVSNTFQNFGFSGSVNTNKPVTGPLAFDGRVFANELELINYAARQDTPSITEYSNRMYSVSQEPDENKARVQVDPFLNQGVYNEDSGTVNLGAGRNEGVTSIALTDDGVLSLATGRSSFVRGMGEVVKTGSGGFGFSGLRGDIVNATNMGYLQTKDLLNRVESGDVQSDTKTTQFLQTHLQNTYEDYINQDLVDDETTYINSFDFTDMPKQRTPEEMIDFDDLDPETTKPETTFQSTTDPFFNQSDDDSIDTGINESVNQETGDAGFGFDDPVGGFDFKKGGEVPKQEGGTTVKPVSQIVQGAGFIAPQQNATDQQTIADDIPMEAEEGDFIINAPAAEFAGRQDIVDMILEAINSLKEKGVDIQYGNPKIPIKSRVQLAVSRNEVYIPKVIAEEIGYDKLEKINNRGKREVERRQQEAQQQANRGGFISKADGDVVEKKPEEEDIPTQIAGLREIIQDLKRGFIDKFGTSPAREKESTEKELDESKYGTERDDIKVDFRSFIRDRLKQLKLKNQKQKETYDLLTDVEIDPKVDPRRGNVPLTQRDRSGLTLGLGFDLGRQGLKELQNYGFSKNLIEKLTPYLGLRGQIARKKHNEDMAFALTDEELDEVNRQVITYGMKEFDRDHPEYQATNPMDYAVLYSAYHVGGLRPDGTRDGKRIKRTPENPKAVRYITFKNVYDKTNDINQALEKGLINKISKGNEERNRAISAKNWFKNRPILSEKVSPIPKPKKPRIRSRGMITPKSRPQEMIMPIPRPKRIQDNPDQESFLAPPVRV